MLFAGKFFKCGHVAQRILPFLVNVESNLIGMQLQQVFYAITLLFPSRCIHSWMAVPDKGSGAMHTNNGSIAHDAITVEPLLTDILYNGHLPATDNSNCTNSLCHSHNTKEASLQRTPLCSGKRTLLAVPNSNLTSELRTKWAGPVLNQQD